ncbi:hypothetical protein BD626DRAFT_484360, partial [Schizophyllum amplum]
MLQSLFPDLLITSDIHTANHRLLGFCWNLNIYWKLLAAHIQNTLLQPFEGVLDSFDSYFLCMADIWSAFVEVCDAYRGAIPPLIDLDTLETHLECIQERYQAVLQRIDKLTIAGERAREWTRTLHDSIARFLDNPPILNRIARCLDEDCYRRDMQVIELRFDIGDVQPRILNCDSELIVQMKSAISDAMTRLPVALVEMRALAAVARASIDEDIQSTQMIVMCWREMDEDRADVVKRFQKC